MVMTASDTAAQREQLLDLVVEMVEQRGTGAIALPELAARAGISQSTLSRHFATREDLIEALAERWFQPKVAIMEEVVESELPARRKMYEFFARRFAMMKAEWERDPAAFAQYVEIGHEHFAVVRSYVDLGDHYLAMIIGEAMADGAFAELALDEALSLINQMVSSYVNIAVMVQVMNRLSTEKLARIIDAIFDGLSGVDRGARAVSALRAA